MQEHWHEGREITEGYVEAGSGLPMSGYVLKSTNTAQARRRIKTASEGGGDGQNLPPYNTLNYIIKT